MVRDLGLEEQLSEDIGALDHLRMTRMFGGMAWLWHGNLLYAASSRGVLYRLGKGNSEWAIQEPGVEPMVMAGRPMEGWVRLSPADTGKDSLRLKLLVAAKTFVAELPPK